MPLRSTGCYTCRKRKIRCDETRPSCKKCSVHGVACPGYRDNGTGTGIEFKDQTRDTVRRAKDGYRVKEDALVRKAPPLQESCFGLPIPTHSAAVDWVGDQFLAGSRMVGMSTGQAGGLSLLPGIVASPAVHRLQLYGTFLDVYLPKNTTHLDHFSFFQTLAAMNTEQPALTQALDALSLVAVGSVHKDKYILNQAVNSYGKALASLVKALARPEAAESDDVFAATSVLTTCALYDEIGSHDNGWGKHVNGTQQLIAARGPKGIQSKLSLLLFSNTRHGALCWALIERRAPYLAQPEWRELAFSTPIQDSSTLFYDAAIQIPGLLGRFDQLGDSVPLSVEFVMELLGECEGIERRLRDWWFDWELKALLDGSLLYEEHAIEDFTLFASLVADRTFSTAYMFVSFPVAYLASMYWMCMHFLRKEIESLQRLRHELDRAWFPSDESAVTQEELYGYCVNLCKTIPYFCEPMSSSTGHVGTFLPMRTAAVHFTQNAQWREAKWVGAVRNSVFTKGLSPPSIGDRPGALKVRVSLKD
ncbi:hypothetical protein LTR62_001262 [Meristemomyces frigidus]|uniref:Zn(2)-C6 fungal-type domain-containing protein n=1 Tax=Meristemomyces frigidus TaxID=1508187 RepID=A0AAN7YBR0_9PEZI|nr:hypothetical protein LTR62_001262 [Meristemomyces frigidus]